MKTLCIKRLVRKDDRNVVHGCEQRFHASKRGVTSSSCRNSTPPEVTFQFVYVFAVHVE